MTSITVKSGQGDYSVTFHEEIGSLVARLAGIPKSAVVIDRIVAQLYATDLRPVTAVPLFWWTPPRKRRRWPARQGLHLAPVAKRHQTNDAPGRGRRRHPGHLRFTAHISTAACTSSCSRPHLWPCATVASAPSAASITAATEPARRLSFPVSVPHQHGVPEHAPRRRHRLGLRRDSQIDVHRLAGPPDKAGTAVAAGGLRNGELPNLIRASLEVKRSIIEVDEYEKDLRRILNYGHTFGHALETLTDHAVPHGLAVAWGMDLVNHLAWKHMPVGRTTTGK